MKKQSRVSKRVDEGPMSGTILVIEDDQGLSRLIQGHLERLNFNVERAVSGAQAIEWLANNRAELALLDYSLPDMTGTDLVKALAENKYSIPFIVVTGRGDEALAVEMMKLGARDYMVKDTTFLDRLPLALQRTFEQLATEHKLAEAMEELRESEEKYRTVLDTIEEGYYEVDLAGNFTFFNDSLCRIIGYPRDELMGMNNRQYLDDETAKAVYKIFNQVYQTGEPDRAFGWEAIRKDGTRVFVEASISLMRGPSGEPVGFRGIIRDITERKRAEEEKLKATREKAAIIDAMGDGLITIGMDGKILSVNPAFERLSGYKKDEFEDKDAASLIPKFIKREEQDSLSDLFSALLKGDIPESKTFTLFNRNGQEIPIFTTASLILDDGGEPATLIIMLKDITFIRQAEEALRRSEEKYRLIAENVTDVIFTIDTNLRFTYISPSVTAQSGFSVEEAMARGLGDTLTPESLEVAVNTMMGGSPEEHMEEEENRKWTTEVEVYCKDGSTIWLEVETTLLYDAEGEAVGIMGVARDITERRRAEEALRESEEKLRVTFESISDAVVIADPEGRLVQVNEAAALITGYTKEELVGRNVLETMIAKKYRNRITRNITKALEEGDAVGIQSCTLMDKDGREFNIEFSTAVLRDSTGNITNFVVVARDITERRRAEEALRENEEKYRNLFEGASDGIFTMEITGEDALFTDCNSRVLTMFECNLEDIIGKSPLDFSPQVQPDGRSSKEKVKELAGAVMAGENKFFEWSHRRLDGTTFEVEVALSRIDVSGKSYLQAIVRDITERRRAEEALRESEERFRLFAETMSDVIWTMDMDLRFTYLSPSTERMRGYTVEESMAQSVEDYLSPESLEVARQTFTEELAIEEMEDKDLYRSRTVVLEQKCKDGSTIWTESKMTFLRDSHNKAIGLLGVTRDVTDRRRAEEALRDSEAKLSLIFQSIRDGIVLSDLEGQILDENEAAVRLQGYSHKEEVIGRNGLEFLAEKDRAMTMEDMTKVIEMGYGPAHEYTFVDKDGREYDAEASASLLRDSSGNATGLISVFRDITERKQAEQALKKSEEKLRAMFESITDGIVITDLKGIILDVNDVIAKMSGMSREEIIGKDGFSLIPRDDRDKVMEGGKKVVSGETGPVRMEHEVSPVIGSSSTTNLVLGTMHDSEGNPTGFVAIAQDFTERKKAEEALKESEAKYRDLVESISDVIYSLDTNGIATYISPVVESVLGYTPSEVIGRSIADVVYPEDLKLATEGFMSILSGNTQTGESLGVTQTGEIRVVTKSGEVRWVRSSNHPVLEEDCVIGVTGVLTDITERKKAEIALRESEDKLRLTFESISDGIVVTDLHGKILDMNGAAAIMAGMSRDEAINRDGLSLLKRKEHKDFIKLGKQALQGDVPILSAERTISTNYGSAYDADLSIGTLHDSAGNPAGYVAVIRDVTERKQAQEALRESQKQLQEFFDSASDLMQTVAPDGRLLWVNRTWREMLGYTEEESNALSLFDIIHPDSLAHCMETFQRVMGGEKVEQIEAKFMTKDGRVIVVEGSANCRFEDGKPVATRGLFRDVTERKRAEEALRESEEKMRVTFESIGDAVAVIDLEGRLAQVNEAAARMTGYTKEELVGRNVLETIIAKKDRDKIVLDMSQTLGEGDALGVRAYTLITKNGREFDTEFSTAVLRDSSGNITNFVGVARDVTERKRAEEERERLLHELERSNAELQQFAHVASHDLQEPLRMVASYTQLLEKRYKGSLDADADDFIAYAVDGAKRMQNLIQGLLSYSRVGSRGKPFEPTECESVFEQAMANLKLTIDESSAEVTHDPLPRVMADETQLIQLFQNLLANAIKFRNEKQPRIHISAKEDSQEFLFSVSDNGIGISPEYFDRIFVIFQRLHGREEYPGTGIGLSVCKRIVERHGGRIWVKSQPGEGSTFYFTIPRGGEEQ